MPDPPANQLQIVLLVDFMSKNLDIAKGIVTKTHSKQRWEAIAAELNNKGPPQKSWEKWNRAWINYKAKTKQKIQFKTIAGIALSPIENVIKNFLELEPPFDDSLTTNKNNSIRNIAKQSIEVNANLSSEDVVSQIPSNINSSILIRQKPLSEENMSKMSERVDLVQEQSQVSVSPNVDKTLNNKDPTNNLTQKLILCRLCVYECTENDTIDIFNNEEESPLTKLIVKYLYLEIAQNENFSNKICLKCFRQLKDFDDFFQHIEQRQQVLNNVFLQNNSTFNFEHNEETLIDVKEIIAEGGNVYVDKFDTHNHEIDVLSLDYECARDSSGYVVEAKDESDVKVSGNSEENKASADILTNFKKSNESFLINSEQDDWKNALEREFEHICEFCGKPFKARPLLKKHIKFDHENNVTHLCQICGINYKYKQTLLRHIKNVHDEISNNMKKECTICNKQISTNYFEKHQELHVIGNKRLERAFKTKNITVKNKPTKLSPEEEKKKDEFIAENIVLKCEICGAIMKDYKSFKLHYRLEHNHKSFITCCGDRFEERFRLIDHIQVHKDPEFFRCKLCNKVLSSQIQLKKHNNNFHTDRTELKHVCNICGKRFFATFMLVAHMNVHKTKLDHVCKLCNKAFKWKQTLVAHTRNSHIEKTLYICDVCGREFRHKQSFEHHIAEKHQIISRDTMTKCEICKQWFSSSCAKKHEILHKLEAVECKKCNKIFQSRASLSKHIKQFVHKNDFYKCQFCEKTFEKKPHFKQHIKLHNRQPL